MKLWAARLIGPPNLASVEAGPRISGDGEQDATVVKLFEEESFFAGHSGDRAGCRT